MSRFIEVVSNWLLSPRQSATSPSESRSTSSSPRIARRHRTRAHSRLESMEDRIVLSSGNLALPGAAANGSAELFRTRKTATQLSISSASGIKGGTTTLVATLTSYGSPLAGKSIRFQVQGRVLVRPRRTPRASDPDQCQVEGHQRGHVFARSRRHVYRQCQFQAEQCGPR